MKPRTPKLSSLFTTCPRKSRLAECVTRICHRYSRLESAQTHTDTHTHQRSRGALPSTEVRGLAGWVCCSQVVSEIVPASLAHSEGRTVGAGVAQDLQTETKSLLRLMLISKEWYATYV